NKEIASLEELASHLYDIGDYDRANNYINHSIAYANDYKSRIRTGQLAKLQEQILSAIHKRHDRQAAANRWYLAILVAILCVLVVAGIYILRQNRLLRKSRHTLNEANAELTRRVDELSAIREELNSANARLSDMYDKAARNAAELAEVNESKEACIANVFAICSNYINKLEDFRADLNRLLTGRQFEKAQRLVKSPELSYGEVKELYAVFDKIFLEIYPDFVDDFNSLLKSEERITLKDPARLTTELRIYALVRLGMNDSVRIAKFLHCSVQTVYNTRHRARNKALAGPEDFARAVMALGK
ncbi:MAG: transcriptional regulator, partial [Muribaculaceae bacterium]|nr:transcriptional regulator [Muribaculaceae bacterium]